MGGLLDRGNRVAAQPRPVAISVLIMGIIVAAGLSIRLVHMGLPASVVKYGGSALWAIAIYWACSMILGSWGPARVAILSGMIATGVEFLKLYNTPWLDEFRRTLAGIILLGRIFNVRDIVDYWVAIAIAAGLDKLVRRHFALRPL
jgi:hypothetical protein